jgi:CheY-like chemotaxis protein
MASLPSEQLARLRDDARRLAGYSATHEGEVRKHLISAEANLELLRTAWSDHAAHTPAGALSQALRSQVTHCYAEVNSAQRLCVAAGENQDAAERLMVRLGASSPADETASVLVVDDYEESREWLSVLLANAGFKVRSASNGLEALLTAYDCQPLVIVMDLMMPVLDGLETARLIRAIDNLQGTHLIAYTARTPPPPSAELFTAVLPKPSPPDVVVETVKRWAAA